MSDLLFHKAAMSQGHIEVLMEIWTLSMMETDGGPPFDSYWQMYEAIDEIKVGSTPWECFKTEIDNNLPDDAPNWCRESYHIWYHNPDTGITTCLTILILLMPSTLAHILPWVLMESSIGMMLCQGIMPGAMQYAHIQLSLQVFILISFTM